ncbi:hypothetical protein [Psychromonas aquimarina]|uniref:hypothetical protein n=1 Tax=Psychromonas aquimarina TaxID=444919 RepID=UPI0003FA9D3E|nr:hypothetical protein [Psychromonas aquimarina]
MEKMTITISPSFSEYRQLQSVSAQTAPTEENRSASQAASAPGDQVEISKEAQEKNMQNKNQQALRKIAGKGQTEKTEKSASEQLDQMITSLQEKIAALIQELSSLRGKDDPQSVQKSRSMEVELASLNAQLMELLQQKLDASQQGS